MQLSSDRGLTRLLRCGVQRQRASNRKGQSHSPQDAWGNTTGHMETWDSLNRLQKFTCLYSVLKKSLVHIQQASLFNTAKKFNNNYAYPTGQQHTHTLTWTATHTHTHTLTWTATHTHTHTHLDSNTHTHTHSPGQQHTHTHTLTWTATHTHTHTHLDNSHVICHSLQQRWFTREKSNHCN